MILDEKNDCTVYAVAAAWGWPYEVAHAAMKGCGRKNKQRFAFKTAAAKLGFELRPDLSCRTLEKIMPEMSKGRFVVRVSRHVFAVVDGRILDTRTTKMKSRVLMVYQLR